MELYKLRDYGELDRSLFLVQIVKDLRNHTQTYLEFPESDCIDQWLAEKILLQHEKPNLFLACSG